VAVNSAYAAKMAPFAARAAAALNMPKEVILAQWSIESGNGTSDHAKKFNNHAGIKVPVSRKFYGYRRQGTAFAGYSSLDAFTNDYISNMSLSFYKNVRGQSTIEGTAKALAKSPWDEGHYGGSGQTLFKVLGITSSGNTPGTVPAPGKPPAAVPAVCPTCQRPL
jgi:flagellum-specific peptidoglycan hydrolase FlgJ